MAEKYITHVNVRGASAKIEGTVVAVGVLVSLLAEKGFIWDPRAEEWVYPDHRE